MRTSIKTFAVAALTVGALVAAPAAFAADTTVSQAVTSGGLAASVAGELAGVTASHTSQSSVASFTLTADDLSGTAAGWNVTQQITELAYDGTNGTNAAIGAANFSVAPGAIIANGGASTTGVAAGIGGSLETAKKVLAAEVGSGVGNYTQTIAATLTVPADSRVGNYTGTLTTTMTTAP
ncbi:hypothetical protein [Arthrobacter sp. H35-D1]|uniref:hypothetical protein n=1 Tax=Arthrobacter sp. H35-D1 TaxID=3046202 RepID=UPI0024BBB3D4|nr:hypothetical protein [Arthrobacter sp. H35-D1]MDJ0315015.1 hypothetical protein [Arthrobacter sp. H35-D1]